MHDSGSDQSLASTLDPFHCFSFLLSFFNSASHASSEPSRSSQRELKNRRRLEKPARIPVLNLRHLRYLDSSGSAWRLSTQAHAENTAQGGPKGPLSREACKYPPHTRLDEFESPPSQVDVHLLVRNRCKFLLKL